MVLGTYIIEPSATTFHGVLAGSWNQKQKELGLGHSTLTQDLSTQSGILATALPLGIVALRIMFQP